MDCLVFPVAKTPLELQTRALREDQPSKGGKLQQRENKHLDKDKESNVGHILRDRFASKESRLKVNKSGVDAAEGTSCSPAGSVGIASSQESSSSSPP